MRAYILTGLISLFAAGQLPGQDGEKPFAEFPPEFERYLKTLHAAGPGELAFREGETKDVAAWQESARAKLSELLGLDRMNRELAGWQTPPPVLEDFEDRGSHTRRRGEIETEPGVVIPFWLLEPKSGKGKNLPLAICAHGHDSIGHDSYAGAWHDDPHRDRIESRGGPVAVQAVERGFVAIAPATRGLAEAASLPDVQGRHGKRACRAQLIHALLAGRTAVGERVWDIQRLLDWATGLENVDPDRILMLGNSGGGVLTLNAAAVDERITVAVPSCSFTSYTSSSGFVFHCDCCLIPRVQRELGDMADVGGLIAPRALLAVHGKTDGLHHFPDVEKAMAHVKAVYSAAGKAERFDHRWGEQGHRFYPDLMWPFIEKWIDGSGEKAP